MNTLSKAIAIAAVAIAPAVAFAQADSNHPLTRAEVRQQLIDLEHAGYNPARSSDAYYPSDIQAAEQRLQEKSGNAVAQAPAPASASGFGGVADHGTSQWGKDKTTDKPADKTVWPEKSIYFGGS